MGNAAQFGLFLLIAYIVFPIFLFFVSWFWYRFCSDDHIAKSQRLSLFGIIGCPVAFLIFALVTDPRSLLPIIAPTWGLVMCLASDQGLRRAAAERRRS